MAKEKSAKKDTKKEATLTLKEKRAAKKLKKSGKRSVEQVSLKKY